MFKIKNKEVTFVNFGNQTDNYYNLCVSCLLGMPVGGINLGMMRESLNLATNFEGKIDIEITEKELNILLFCVNSMKWAFKDIEIINFVDYINNLK